MRKVFPCPDVIMSSLVWPGLPAGYCMGVFMVAPARLLCGDIHLIQWSQACWNERHPYYKINPLDITVKSSLGAFDMGYPYPIIYPLCQCRHAVFSFEDISHLLACSVVQNVGQNGGASIWFSKLLVWLFLYFLGEVRQIWPCDEIHPGSNVLHNQVSYFFDNVRVIYIACEPIFIWNGYVMWRKFNDLVLHKLSK